MRAFLVFGIFVLCFYQPILAKPKNSQQLLSLLDNSGESKFATPIDIEIEPELKKIKESIKIDRKGRQILLQEMQQVANKQAEAKQFVEVEDDWRDSIIGVWDWFVNGISQVTNNVVNLATQIMSS